MTEGNIRYHVVLVVPENGETMFRVGTPADEAALR